MKIIMKWLAVKGPGIQVGKLKNSITQLKSQDK
jgi:hypothetical protein